jgi:sortase (surface protein transpeptidase)
VNGRPARSVAILFSLALLLALFAPGAAQAQTSPRCFPETGYCITGRIREYWERNGGLSVFGFPLTPLQQERVENRTVQLQWFERNRLELHPENARPYDVLLGRIGAERLAAQQPGWQTLPHTQAEDGCLTFAETGRAICGDILAAWRANGLNLDGSPAISKAESLALFGLPLTDPRPEQQSDGRTYVVQWYERARFELHPENRPPYHVLLGLLGRESSPLASASPAPVAASAPARLVIDSIGLDARVVGVGMDARGELVVPDHDVGWYDRSARPGQGENVVFWGHVLRFRHAPQTPAPFARLKELPIGASLTIYDAQGTPHAYKVAQQIQARPNQVEYILPKGREIVTMVSCYGDSVIVGGEVVDMTKRLITIAEPA